MLFELIDSNGPVQFSAEEAVHAIRTDGLFRTIHLDANLTLDLAKIGAGRLDPTRGTSSELLQLAVRTDSAIDCDLAIAEMSEGALRAAGDRTRRSSLQRDVPLGVRAVERSLMLRVGSVSVGHLGRREVDSYSRVHLAFYTHLLKIEQMARTRLGKSHSVLNLSEYLTWADTVARNVSAHCLQVAFDVFGGESRAARLLSIASSKPQKSRAWNAAWDLVHAFAMHYETTRPIGRTMKRAFLATRDQALSYVARRCVVAAFVRASPIGDVTLAGFRIDQPFLIHQQNEVRLMLERTFESQRRRIDQADSASPGEMARLRDQLEAELGILAFNSETPDAL